MVEWLSQSEWRARHLRPPRPPRLCERDGERLPHKHCIGCGAFVTHVTRGRQKMACNVTCRSRAHRARKAARQKASDIPKNPVGFAGEHRNRGGARMTMPHGLGPDELPALPTRRWCVICQFGPLPYAGRDRPPVTCNQPTCRDVHRRRRQRALYESLTVEERRERRQAAGVATEPQELLEAQERLGDTDGAPPPVDAPTPEALAKIVALAP